MENNYYVYQYSDPRTNLPFYIGKGRGNRINKHLTETKENTENYKKWAFIQGLRNNGLEPVVSFVKEQMTSEEAYKLEDELILKYGRKNIDKNGILTNICINQRPPVNRGLLKGRKLSEEHVKKSVATRKKNAKPNPLKGVPNPKVAGKNNPMYGINVYEYMIEKYGEEKALQIKIDKINKVREKVLGRNHTEEAKEKMRYSQKEANKGRVWVSNDELQLHKFINSEAVESFILENEGWYIGRKRYKVSKDRVDGSITNKGYVWAFKDGVSKMFKTKQDVPAGWKLGRFRREKKISHL